METGPLAPGFEEPEDIGEVDVNTPEGVDRVCECDRSSEPVVPMLEGVCCEGVDLRACGLFFLLVPSTKGWDEIGRE